MITILSLLAIGAVLGVVGLFCWARFDTARNSRARAKEYVRLEQRRNEVRIQQITQDAVQQMLDLARRSQ